MVLVLGIKSTDTFNHIRNNICNCNVYYVEEKLVNRIIDRIKRMNEFQRVNLGIFLVWLVIGILTLMSSDISKLSYLCVWVLMLVSTLENAFK